MRIADASFVVGGVHPAGFDGKTVLINVPDLEFGLLKDDVVLKSYSHKVCKAFSEIFGENSGFTVKESMHCGEKRESKSVSGYKDMVMVANVFKDEPGQEYEFVSLSIRYNPIGLHWSGNVRADFSLHLTEENAHKLADYLLTDKLHDDLGIVFNDKSALRFITDYGNLQNYMKKTHSMDHDSALHAWEFHNYWSDSVSCDKVIQEIGEQGFYIRDTKCFDRGESIQSSFHIDVPDMPEQEFYFTSKHQGTAETFRYGFDCYSFDYSREDDVYYLGEKTVSFLENRIDSLCNHIGTIIGESKKDFSQASILSDTVELVSPDISYKSTLQR